MAFLLSLVAQNYTHMFKKQNKKGLLPCMEKFPINDKQEVKIQILTV